MLRAQSADEVVALVENPIANEAAAGRTGPRFAEAFRRTADAGLRHTVHAGESSGPEGVRNAVELLGADRIDHGVPAVEDDHVVALLAERGIPLDICPTSNLTIKVYPLMPSRRPPPKGGRQGVGNTDDSSLLATNLSAEYKLASAAFGWSDEIVRDVARTSIDALPMPT